MVPANGISPPFSQRFQIFNQRVFVGVRQPGAEGVAAVAVAALAGVVMATDALGLQPLADEADRDRVVDVVAAPELMRP